MGDAQSTRVDVRIIAATNSDLTEMVEQGTFRQDLFYRLNVIPIHLPALRERREDVPLLVQSFVDRLGRSETPPRTNVVVSQEAMRQMMAFRWPGNIRQLENAIERALALTPGRSQINVGDLPPEIQQGDKSLVNTTVSLPEGGIDLQDYLHHLERGLIRLSLERTGGNKQKAAELLKIKRTTLVEKTKRLGADS